MVTICFTLNVINMYVSLMIVVYFLINKYYMAIPSFGNNKNNKLINKHKNRVQVVTYREEGGGCNSPPFP